MPARRILSLWFPRLAAERILRQEPVLSQAPFAVTTSHGNLLSFAQASSPAQPSPCARLHS